MITHLACVMDGNRRWAKIRGQLPWNGHRAGAQTVRIVIDFCLQYQIPYLSLYTFSLENFQRTQEERSYLFDLIVQQVENYAQELKTENIKIKFIGNLSLFPELVQNVCKNIEEETAHNNRLQVNFLFGYGGRQEIFAAAQCLAAKMIAGLSATQDDFKHCLSTQDIPDPDLVIRTGGVQRLSNFLLYQSAYAEIRFLDVLWPDLTKDQIYDAVMSAVHVQKNLGR